MNAPAATATLAELRSSQSLAPREANLPIVRMGFDTPQGFDLLQRASKAFASSDLVPAQYRGNIANCMIALEMAGRIGASPMMVMQNLYIVHGSPGWSAKFLIACINSSGRFTSLRYEWRGEPGKTEFGCRAWAVEHATGERLNGIWVDWKMVKAEGWDTKNGSKWKTMPDQMFVYRSAAFWQRAYAPEISMGMQTDDELRDVIDTNPDGSYTVTTEALRGGMRSLIDPETGAPPVATPAGAAPSAEPEGEEPPQPAADAPHVTYAEIMDRMQKAKTVDELDEIASLIESLPALDQKKELTVAYRQLRAKLAGE